jgi:hypothetical protein
MKASPLRSSDGGWTTTRLFGRRSTARTVTRRIVFFLNVPTQELYRNLILDEHGALHAAFPDRYKVFIRSGDDEHTALQRPTFYLSQVDGVTLDSWTSAFLVPTPFWENLVEDLIPLQ